MSETTGMAGSGPILTGLKLVDGVFTATVSGGTAQPLVDLVIDGRVVGNASFEPALVGFFSMSVPMPRQCLSDGDVAIVFQDRTTGAGLATYLVSSGYPPARDVLAEVAALRAEFETLKRAFLEEAWHEKLRKADRPLIVGEIMEAVERYLLERDSDEGV